MPNPSFRALRAMAKERQAKDLTQFESRKSLFHGELGHELFNAQIEEAAQTRNVHGPNGLIELKSKVKDLYRSNLQKRNAEKNEAMRMGYTFMLKRYRNLLGSLDTMIKQIEPKK